MGERSDNLPKHLICPLDMMAIRLQSASHSSIEWLVNTIDDRPDSRRPIKVAQIFRRDAGSTPVVGSSRNITDGPPIAAIAKPNFRLFPPLRLPFRVLRKLVRSVDLMMKSTFFGTSFSGIPLEKIILKLLQRPT